MSMGREIHHRDPDSPRGAWAIALAAAGRADEVRQADQVQPFAICENGELHPVSGQNPAVIAWRPDAGWESLLEDDDPRRGLLDLYLPICSATSSHPITIGHLGQSLDGFIATHSGDSQYVTGRENILHLHRLRALCQAVIVGAGTVAADDPQLTTRQVQGPSPLRVVFDPGRRLAADYRVFTDDSAPTLYACDRSLVETGESRVGGATIVGLEGRETSGDVAELVRVLRERGCSRIFVEGGGVTVSAFLEADLLDRLHMAVAPLLIGDGRPAIRLAGHAALRDCRRPRYRVFRMGGDVLFDCDLRTPDEDTDRAEPGVERVI